MGGCLLTDNLDLGRRRCSRYIARPPDPALVGERWREMWLRAPRRQRRSLVDNWLRHQRRDAFWKHGSVCEDYAAIDCAVYAVGGWADGYTNAVLAPARRA